MGIERLSAGLLMYRKVNNQTEVFLIHPGGPYFIKKDEGNWSIPKGEPNDGENDLFKTALREFEEETGIKPLENDYIPLDTITQKGGKIVYAWAFESNLPENFKLKSNTFFAEWPPRSGRKVRFPEADKAEFFNIEEAKRKIKNTQVPFIERLLDYLEK